MDNKNKESHKKLSENLRVLDPEYVPKKIIPLNNRFFTVYESISETINYNEDINIVLCGVPGSGRYTLSLALKIQLEKDLCNSRKTFHTAVIDLSEHTTSTQVFLEILRQINPENPAIKGKKNSVNSEDLLDRYITSDDAVFFITFIEKGQMIDESILRYLAYLRKLTGEKTGPYENRNSNIITLTITSNARFIDCLSYEIASFLEPRFFSMPRLSEEQMYEILKERAEELFDKTIDNEVIAKCAKTVGESGCGGYGGKVIELLKLCVVIAEKSNSNHITLEHFEIAYDMALHEEEVNSTALYLSYQAKQTKLALYSILEILENNNHITTGQVYEDYSKRWEKPVKTVEAFSQIITILCSMGLIQTEMVYRGRKGNTRKITVDDSMQGLMREAIQRCLAIS